MKMSVIGKISRGENEDGDGLIKNGRSREKGLGKGEWCYSEA